GGRHLTRALAVVEGISNSIPNDVNGIVGSTYLSQGRLVPQQHRRHVQGELLVAHPGFSQQLERVTELAGVAIIDLLHLPNTQMLNGGGWYTHPEGDLGKDDQLLGSIGAIDIKGRIRFSKTAALGLGQSFGV